MGLEAKLKKKRTCDEVSDMAICISDVFGDGRMEVNEHSQDYTEFSSYRTKAFDISYNTDMYGPEIKYKGKLVFRVTRKRHYCKPGDWQEAFDRLYSRALNKDNKRRNELDNQEYKD